MIDPQFKADWIAALRSGRYPQTTGRLKDAFGYCCLGVACALRGVDFDSISLLETSWELGGPGTLGDVIPGISEAMADELASMNDSPVPFSDIADFIEDIEENL